MKITLDDYRFIGTELGRYIAEHVPGLDAAVYCKHHLGTLTPGFSDHDLRTVAAAPDAETWLALSRAGGESYVELLEQAPHYARILEHPPGFICSPDEAQQLLPLMGEVRDWQRIGGVANALDEVLANQPPQLTPAQQLEACGKYKMFLVPRPEQFDPPINLLPELLPYYPVYGALSHWFLPAAKLACSLLRDAWVPTKPAALPVLPEVIGPQPLLERLNEIVDAGYRVRMTDDECAAMADELLEVVYELRDRVSEYCQQLAADVACSGGATAAIALCAAGSCRNTRALRHCGLLPPRLARPLRRRVAAHAPRRRNRSTEYAVLQGSDR